MPGFTTPDPLAEMHPNESPYAYCGNNPVNRVDPTGLDWYYNSNSDAEPVWMAGSGDQPGYDSHSNTCQKGSVDDGHIIDYPSLDGYSSQYISDEINYSLFANSNGSSGGNNIVGDRSFSNSVGGGSSNQNSSGGQNGGSSNETLLKISTAAGVVSTDIDLAIKTADIVDKLGPLAKGLSVAGHAGTFLGAASAGYSTYKVVNQFQIGGIRNVNGLDATDAAVGWLGTAASVATTLLLQ